MASGTKSSERGIMWTLVTLNSLGHKVIMWRNQFFSLVSFQFIVTRANIKCDGGSIHLRSISGWMLSCSNSHCIAPTCDLIMGSWPKGQQYDTRPEVRTLKSEVWSPKSEVRSPNSELRSPKSEVRSLKSEVWSTNTPSLHHTSLMLVHLSLVCPYKRPPCTILTWGTLNFLCWEDIFCQTHCSGVHFCCTLLLK
jgi:hypothetical protein